MLIASIAYPLYLLVIVFLVMLSITTPFHVLSQTILEKNVSLSLATPTEYKPVNLTMANLAKEITNLRTANGNISNLEFTTSYNYQYITWIEQSGRENVIYVTSSRDGGKTFDIPVNLSRSNGDASNQHFVVNLDRMYGVFVQHEPGNNDVIKFTGTNDGGTNWYAYTLVDPHNLVYELAIALQGDQVSVAWSDTNNVNTVNHYIINR